MFPLQTFALSDMLQASAGLRRSGRGATSMEEAAQSVVRYLYDNLLDKESGERATALARFYKTHPFARLEPELQELVLQQQPAVPEPQLSCLTLLGTAGDDAAWNDRRLSTSHRAIPLPSADAVGQSPMVAQLVRQLGFEPEELVAPDPSLFVGMEQRDFGVFYVAEAAGSVHVPAQAEFVQPYGIRSVLGFGGVLPSGAMFAVVLFSKVLVSPDVAELFSSVALSAKVAILPFVDGATFAGEASGAPPSLTQALRASRSTVAALEQLLDVRGDVVATQTVKLEAAVEEARRQAEEARKSRAALAKIEARKTAIFEAALDCIVTMDAAGRIVEFNPAAEALFGYERSEVVNRPLADVVIPVPLRDLHRDGLARYLASGEARVLGRRIEITALRRDGSEFPVELTITRVDLPGPPLFTGYLRDITARHRAEEALRRSSELSAHIARTLQESLLPPILPEVPGVSVGASYRPAGDGSELGGDFYDVFQTASNDWAMVLGDVCGKGAAAATVTALARYTLRAAAMRARRPTAVLAMLNEAVWRQHPEIFCTAVYCRLRSTAKGVMLTAASGGHPPALLLSANGAVSEIRSPGLLLGVFEKWEGRDRSLSLSPGDTVVLYSDGVTEARRRGEQFGSERLEKLVATTAQLDPADIAASIEREVLDYQGGTAADDIAVLVIRAT